MELGKIIKKLRLKAGLTQEQLSETLGVGAQAVSKWETGAALPDITLLPPIAETFGVSIDDLFDLTAAERLNRIENRLDTEEELPNDVFRDFEDFLKAELDDPKEKARATSLIAYLYWHRMNSSANRVRRYAKEAILADPGKKDCQWLLQKAEGHVIWDWNLAHHAEAIDFYRGITESHPDLALPLEYLLDNLIADHRIEEAEKALDRLETLPKSNPALNAAYRAGIALARFDEKTADRIMEDYVKAHGDDTAALFETAQYYAKKGDYERAIGYYEQAFEKDPERPRFQDALMAIAVIHEIRGDYREAAKTYDRILTLLKDEWGLTEEVEVKQAEQKKAELLGKVK